jgi:replicative DNA helicase
MNVENTTINPALIGDLASELLEREAIAREAVLTGKAPGPITGLPMVDETIGGYMAPGLHVLLAPPGAGKTALALQIAGNCGCPALYVTAEMPRVELLRRIISRTTGTYLGKLRGGKMSAEELRANITQAARTWPMVALYDAIVTPASVADIEAKAASLRERFEANHALVIVDSVTDWALSHGAAMNTAGSDERIVTEMALNGLRALALKLSIPVLAIAHRNRASKASSGADKLHAAKGTGRYEYVGESLWDLDRDIGKDDDANHRKPAELTIWKNRNGQSGVSIELEFEGRVQKFTEAGAVAEIRDLTTQHRANSHKMR